MSIIIEAPNEDYSLESYKNIKIFLAGGISKCEDWQSYVIQRLQQFEDLTIYNPRRQYFDFSNYNESERQIIWENRKLHMSDIILFWFAYGSDNPIALFELGVHGHKDNVLVGTDPNYSRKFDVEIQHQLQKDNCQIVKSLNDLCRGAVDMITKIGV